MERYPYAVDSDTVFYQVLSAPLLMKNATKFITHYTRKVLHEIGYARMDSKRFVKQYLD